MTLTESACVANLEDTEMLKLAVAVAVVATSMTGFVYAEEAKGPIVMTEAQLDEIVAGEHIPGIAVSGIGNARGNISNLAVISLDLVNKINETLDAVVTTDVGIPDLPGL